MKHQKCDLFFDRYGNLRKSQKNKVREKNTRHAEFTLHYRGNSGSRMPPSFAKEGKTCQYSLEFSPCATL